MSIKLMTIYGFLLIWQNFSVGIFTHERAFYPHFIHKLIWVFVYSDIQQSSDNQHVMLWGTELKKVIHYGERS